MDLQIFELNLIIEALQDLNAKMIDLIIKTPQSEVISNNFEYNNKGLDCSELLEKLESIKKDLSIVTFDSLKIGNTINYDIALRQDSYKNETMFILDKNSTHVKLFNLVNNFTWYCSRKFFDQLLNVSIIEND